VLAGRADGILPDEEEESTVAGAIGGPHAGRARERDPDSRYGCPKSSCEIEIRAATPGDREAIVALLRDRWGGETMVVHDTVYRPADLPAFVAVDDPHLVGLVTYEPGIESWHVLSLDSLDPGRGIGGALLDRVEAAARAAGSPRVMLVTTNDNLDAIRFYQRRGYRIAAIDPGAIDRARRKKPSIPLIGCHGIPIRDEITLVKNLDADNAASG
jgi:ribosomal protein S18 acetylase RimI-like enzyme